MKKLDFFKTKSGQQYLRHRRQLSRLYFSVSQEPKSKNGISLKNKTFFQQEIYKELVRKKRRFYRSPVILEIDFFSSSQTPPSIYKLAKNYLDLLEDTVNKSGIKRKKLLYKDDKLVKILLVNHYINSKWVAPSISVRVDTLRNFIFDLQLVEEYNLLDDFDNDINFSNFSETKLQSLDNNKEEIIKKFDKKYYISQRDWLVRATQEKYLQSG